MTQDRSFDRAQDRLLGLAKGPIVISIVGEVSSFFLLAAGSRRFDQE